MAKFCGKCGAKITGEGKFCSSCGMNIDELEEENNTPESLTDYQIKSPKKESKKVDTEIPDEEAKDIDFGVESHQSELQSMPEIKEAKNPKEEIYAKLAEETDEDERDELIEELKNPAKQKNNIPQKQVNYKRRTFLKVFAVLFVILALGAGLAFYKAYTDKNEDDLPKKIGNIDAYRVGTPDYGYVSLPTTWQRYTTQEGGATLQYSDGTGWITTLYSISMQQLAPHSWSNTIVEEMKKMGAENVNLEPTKVYQYDGFYISGYYRNVNVYISAWIFDAKDNKTHYISIEGPGKLTKENSYSEIVNSFRVDR